MLIEDAGLTEPAEFVLDAAGRDGFADPGRRDAAPEAAAGSDPCLPPPKPASDDPLFEAADNGRE